MSVEKSNSELADEILQKYLILDGRSILALFDRTIVDLGDPLLSIARAFRENIVSTITVGSIPFAMATAAASRRNFERIFLAERIRSLKGRAPNSGTDDVVALRRATERYGLESVSPENTAFHMRDVMNDLQGASVNEDFKAAIAELLRQSLTMVWSAFEVALTDSVVCLINNSPSLALELASCPETRKYFQQKGVSFETLASHGFDLNKVMGDILFSDLRFDKLQTMRDVLQSLLPSRESLHRSLAKEDFWLLWQRRHLIVHRRSIVDATYVSKTGDRQPLGQRLEISAHDVEKALRLVVDFASELFPSLVTAQ